MMVMGSSMTEAEAEANALATPKACEVCYAKKYRLMLYCGRAICYGCKWIEMVCVCILSMDFSGEYGICDGQKTSKIPVNIISILHAFFRLSVTPSCLYSRARSHTNTHTQKPLGCLPMCLLCVFINYLETH